MLSAAIFLVVVNMAAFAAMGFDKLLSRRKWWRIPEATLFLLVVIGGSIGGIAGMWIFHHKTKTPIFFIGFPAILIFQIIGIALVLSAF